MRANIEKEHGKKMAQIKMTDVSPNSECINYVRNILI